MKHHRTFTTICVTVALMVHAAMAGTVDDYFEEGVLGLKWDATLPQVQEKFPGGVTYPTTGERGDTHLTYHVTVETKAIGIELPKSFAIFSFTKSQTLRNVSFHFSYADRETVLYQVAEAIGQDYVSRDDELEHVYRWDGLTSFVALSVGRVTPHTWVYLQVWSDSDRQRRRP
jgi:hypothetical protein